MHNYLNGIAFKKTRILSSDYCTDYGILSGWTFLQQNAHKQTIRKSSTLINKLQISSNIDLCLFIVSKQHEKKN